MIAKESEIKFTIGLDENKVPEDIKWMASDAGMDVTPSKAVMMSVWDEKTKNTLRIDLWTKEMTVDEMKQFYHQSFLSMADSFERATDETKMAIRMREFAKEFAEKMELL